MICFDCMADANILWSSVRVWMHINTHTKVSVMTKHLPFRFNI